VWFHLNAAERAPRYDPIEAGVDEDLTYVLGPIEPVLKRLSPLLKRPVKLTDAEFDDLIAFLREGIFDPRALPKKLCKLIPPRVPSGKPLLKFEGCPQ